MLLLNLDLRPDSKRRCCSRNSKLDQNSKFLLAIKDQRLGDSFYLSKLNNKIYHLSVWVRGESSNPLHLDLDSSVKDSTIPQLEIPLACKASCISKAVKATNLIYS